MFASVINQNTFDEKHIAGHPYVLQNLTSQLKYTQCALVSKDLLSLPSVSLLLKNRTLWRCVTQDVVISPHPLQKNRQMHHLTASLETRVDQRFSPELINWRVKAYLSRLGFLRLLYIYFLCFTFVMSALSLSPSNVQIPFDCFKEEQGGCWAAGKERRYRTCLFLLCLVWLGRCQLQIP